MTGVVLALAGCFGAAGGAGGAPNPMMWSNPFGFTLASTQVLTVSGVGGGASTISATNSGGAVLSCIHNGSSTIYTGSFPVSDGDTLGWSLLNTTSSTETGTVVVTSGSFTVGTFTYVVRGDNNY